MKIRGLVAVALLVVACASGVQAQEQDEIEFVTIFFNELQPKSIAENKEYCGFFGFDENGEYKASAPTPGDEASCLPAEPPHNLEIFASYHTHGGFSDGFDSEVPSSNDLEADIAEELDGYVATPGGRIWFNDARQEMASLLCGRNCTVSDVDYDALGVREIRNSYTLNQLLQREAE